MIKASRIIHQQTLRFDRFTQFSYYEPCNGGLKNSNVVITNIHFDIRSNKKHKLNAKRISYYSFLSNSHCVILPFVWHIPNSKPKNNFYIPGRTIIIILTYVRMNINNNKYVFISVHLLTPYTFLIQFTIAPMILGVCRVHVCACTA